MADEREGAEQQRTEAPDGSPGIHPVVVRSQTFRARPSSFPEIGEFARRHLAGAPVSDEEHRELQEAVAQALLEAAGPAGTFLHVSVRIFPDGVEVEVLKSPAAAADLPSSEAPTAFAAWMAALIQREGLSKEAAARQLGVSAKTVRRWVGGATTPRPKERQRIRDAFGDRPIP